MKNLGYSQNFLVNKKLVERLISKSNIDVTDYVIEIGPGKGIITDVLSQHAGEVVAVEYDQELYNNLVRYHSHDNVTYIFGDFLKYKLPLNRRYKIFSNIPFQITADIIRKLTDDYFGNVSEKNRLTQKRFWFHPPQLEMMVREKESLYVWSAL